MAAVDVFDREPLRDPDDPLLTLPNVVCSQQGSALGTNQSLQVGAEALSGVGVARDQA